MTTTDPRQTVRLPAAPPLRPRDGGALLLALPALGGVGSAALVASSGLAGSGAMRARSLVAAGFFLLVTVAFVALQLERQRRRRHLDAGLSRDDHLAHLARLRGTVAGAAAAQRARALQRHPGPAALTTTAPVATEGHPLRIGLGSGPLALRLEPAEPVPGQPPDPVCQRALDRFAELHGVVHDLPVELDLSTVALLCIDGPVSEARGLARAWVCSAARHDAERLRIGLLSDDADTDEAWEWLKWLPHHGAPDRADAVGPARLVARRLDDLLDDRGARHLLVVDERRGARTEHLLHGVTVLRLGPIAAPATVATASATIVTAGSRPRVTRDGVDVTPSGFRPDNCGPATASAYARRLAATGRPSASADLTALLRTSPRQPLRTPIGTAADGSPVHLDLREPAAGGHGPHGLVVGATGSGKSELLRTLVTGLALIHPPEELNVVLVDFKGGATFAALAALPHASALITNLADDLVQVDRMHQALSGELVRRQHVLRDAGVTDTDELAGTEHRLPRLLVVVDEFTELLATRPELAELFAGIGRLGRSLGVHLLLASQRLDEGRLRGLESHLGFRIALRTFSAADSRAAIGSPDAFALPSQPGAGYLSTGPGELVGFRTTLVSRAVRRDVPGQLVLPFTAAPVHDSGATETVEPSLLERAVAESRRRAGPARVARPIWLPPLLRAPSLDDLLAATTRPGGGRLPVGLVDLPFEQRHAPLLLDLTGSHGHAAVVGAPRSGRSTLLQTIATALSSSIPPERLRLAVVDLDGSLAGLTELAGTSAYVRRTSPDELHALVRDLVSEAARRRSTPDAGQPDLFVLVDGWAALRERWPEVEAQLVSLAQESLAVGIHLLLTATRWSDLRPALRDVVGTRLELRLGDPMDSEHGRQRAQAVPRDPGHGLTPGGHHFLGAVPGHPVSDGRRP